jgi:hypothetical protein
MPIGDNQPCKCRNCNQLYVPDPRSRHHQEYCALAECRKASKAASQRRWLQSDKGRDYFRGSYNRDRVKKWRKAHPGYWRKQPDTEPSCVLQDVPPPQTPVPPAVQSSCNAPDVSALQDMILSHSLVLTGLVVQFTGALQDQIVPAMQRLVRLGQQYSGPASGVAHGGFQASALQTAVAASAPAIQLDRPSPGP